MVGGLLCCLGLENTHFDLLCLHLVFSLLWISGISAVSKAWMRIYLEGYVCSYWKHQIQSVFIWCWQGRRPVEFSLSKTITQWCVMGGLVTNVCNGDQSWWSHDSVAEGRRGVLPPGCKFQLHQLHLLPTWASAQVHQQTKWRRGTHTTPHNDTSSKYFKGVQHFMCRVSFIPIVTHVWGWDSSPCFIKV